MNLTPEKLRHLVVGQPLFEGEGFRTLAEFKAAWKAHGAAITREFVKSNPGRRPFGWWLCTHKQERPIVAEWVQPITLKTIRADANAETFGYLHTEIYGGPEMTSLQEDQTDYLDRLGLLSKTELSRIERDEDDTDEM